MIFSKKKNNEQATKESTNPVNKPVEASVQPAPKAEVYDQLNKNAKIIYNDKYHVSEIIYSNRDPNIYKDDAYFIKPSLSRSKKFTHAQSEVHTNKYYNNEAYLKNSDSILENVKDQIFNETYKLLGIKPKTNDSDELVKISSAYQTGDKFEDAMLGLAADTDANILKEIKEDATFLKNQDILRTLDANGKVIPINDENQELDAETRKAINEFARKFDSSVAPGNLDRVQPFEDENINQINRYKSEQERLALEKQLKKDLNAVDNNVRKIDRIEDLFIKPNEQKTVLFKETAPIINNDLRSSDVNELKDTQWERVKEFVKEFNTRSYAEVVGNVPGIIDVDNAIKVDLNEKFYLSKDQLQKNHEKQEQQFKNIILEYNQVLEKQQAESLKEIFDEINKKPAVEFDNKEFVEKQNLQNEANIKIIDENIRLKQEIKQLKDKLSKKPEVPVLEPKMSKLELEDSLILLTPEKAEPSLSDFKKNASVFNDLNQQTASEEIDLNEILLKRLNQQQIDNNVLNNQINLESQELKALNLLNQAQQLNANQQQLNNLNSNLNNASINQQASDLIKNLNNLANTNSLNNLNLNNNQDVLNQAQQLLNKANLTNQNLNNNALNNGSLNNGLLSNNQLNNNQALNNSILNNNLKSSNLNDANNALNQAQQLLNKANLNNTNLNQNASLNNKLNNNLNTNGFNTNTGNLNTQGLTGLNKANLNNANLNNLGSLNNLKTNQNLNEANQSSTLNKSQLSDQAQQLLNKANLTNQNLSNNALNNNGLNNGLLNNNQKSTNGILNNNLKSNNLNQTGSAINNSSNLNAANNALNQAQQLLNKANLNNTNLNQNASLNNKLNNNLNTNGFNTNASNLNTQGLTGLNKVNLNNANLNNLGSLNNLKTNQNLNEANQSSTLNKSQLSDQAQQLLNKANLTNQNLSNNALNNNGLNNGLLNNNQALNNNQQNVNDISSQANQLINDLQKNIDQFNAQANNVLNAQNQANEQFKNINNDLSKQINSLNNSINNLNQANLTTDDYIKQLKLKDVKIAQDQIHNNLYKIDEQVLSNLVPTTSKINQMHQNPLNDVLNQRKFNGSITSRNNYGADDNTYMHIDVDNSAKKRAQLILNSLRKARQYAQASSRPNYDGNMFNSNYIPPRISLEELRASALSQDNGIASNNNVMSLADACKVKRKPY